MRKLTVLLLALLSLAGAPAAAAADDTATTGDQPVQADSYGKG